MTFDIERTNGGGDALAAAFTDAFAACKRAGLLVMVSTSHSAPWDAPDGTKDKIVDAWVRSPDVDIFSPQAMAATPTSRPPPPLTLTLP